ncbi:MAG: tetratricopeptide repeat protein, partial [Candidatus Latescibacterota bacterium]|nr:tetratricopeptide repeat protein [Candidatus Latescibacterota bacterium]
WPMAGAAAAMRVQPALFSGLVFHTPSDAAAAAWLADNARGCADGGLVGATGVDAGQRRLLAPNALPGLDLRLCARDPALPPRPPAPPPYGLPPLPARPDAALAANAPLMASVTCTHSEAAPPAGAESAACSVDSTRSSATRGAPAPPAMSSARRVRNDSYAAGPPPLRTSVALAELLAERGEADEAGALYRTALRGLEATLGPVHPLTLQTTDALGMVLAEQGKRGLP